MSKKPLDSEDQPNPEAGFSSNEVAGILSRYDIGTISSVRAYERGSSRAPKALIESDAGEFLLKRRAPGRDEPRRIKFEHTVHGQLRKAGYPVAEIMASRRSRSTAIRGSHGMYELFRFIRASRCHGTSIELEACGAALSDFHGILNDFDYPARQGGGFHGVSRLDKHVEKYSSHLSRRSRRVCNQIRECYTEAAQNVDSLGWSKWSTTIVHGDWHPGNVLFGDRSNVRVVLDFDNVRREPRIVDIASAILHFGRYVTALHNDEGSTWPVQLHEPSVKSLARGYASHAARSPVATELAALPALMVEAIALETIPSLLREGRFGDHSINDFLPVVSDSLKNMLSNSGRLIATLQTILG
ncbi:MAG: phosphotransferase [Phycisphaerales bacterium]|nr:phosphotransferase [Phycisphaerales bacterium]